MTRAGIAELKANLSAYLRRVRKGETITVMDRDTPIARIVEAGHAGAGGLRVRHAQKPLAGLTRPRPIRPRADIVQLLLEERGER